MGCGFDVLFDYVNKQCSNKKTTTKTTTNNHELLNIPKQSIYISQLKIKKVPPPTKGGGLGENHN